MGEEKFNELKQMIIELLETEFMIAFNEEPSWTEIHETLEEIIQSYEGLENDFYYIDIDPEDIRKELEMYREHKKEIESKKKDPVKPEDIQVNLQLPAPIEEMLKETAASVQNEEADSAEMDRVLDKINHIQEQNVHEFGGMLQHVQAGSKWTRLEWKPDVYVSFQDTLIFGYLPVKQLILHNKNGISKYVPSDEDMFTKDWYIWRD